MTVITFFAPPPLLEAEAVYFWRMARNLHDARRVGNDAAASEYVEALEILGDVDDYVAIRAAARRSLEPLPSGTPSVVLKFPTPVAPRRRQPAPKVRRRA
jgi:hypothetical protein